MNSSFTKSRSISLIIAICVLTGLNSCRQMAIGPRCLGVCIHGGDPTDSLYLQDVSFWDYQDTSFIFVAAKMQYENGKYYNYGAAFYDNCDELDKTPEQKFAFEKIQERTAPVHEVYNAFFKGKSTLFYSNVYSRDEPYVIADKTLWGKDPGEDLSSFFVIAAPRMRITGPNYNVVVDEEYDPRRDPLRLYAIKEYCTAGTMMPSFFTLHLVTIPEEFFEESSINITFIFPVTVEHYWSWLTELYKNPKVDKTFTDTNLILKVNLKDVTYHMNKDYRHDHLSTH